MSGKAPSLFDGPVRVTPLAASLRPYQQAAVDGIYSWFARESGNPLVVVPTGGGKSIIQAAFIHSVLSQWPKERIVCLTHVRELIAQNHAALLRAWPGAPAGIYSASLKRRESDAPVLFAGIQSVYKHAAKIGWTDLVVVDEAHLIPTGGFGMYRTFLNDLRSMNQHLKVIGLTATPYRTDSGSLDKGDDRIFHGVAYDCDLTQLIADGYLSPVVSKGTRAAIDTSGVHHSGGDFVARELEAAAMVDGKVQAAVKEIVARGQDRRSWLVFCCGLDHARAVRSELDRNGISSECVFGDTPPAERDRIVADYVAGRLRSICNVNVLTTGFDAPQTDLIALLRPTESPGLFVQMVGRGLRRADGKTNCLVLDFGSNVMRHGPIDHISVREPGEKDENATVPARECPNCQTLVHIAARVCPECGFEWAVLDGERAAKHETKPDEDSALIACKHPTGGIEKWERPRVRYLHHLKRGGTRATLRVEYETGFRQCVSEFICFEHEPGSFPHRKAVRWWRERARVDSPVPISVDQALIAIECGALTRQVECVTVDVRGEYPAVMAVRLGREPGEDNEMNEQTKPGPTSQTNYDDIPF